MKDDWNEYNACRLLFGALEWRGRVIAFSGQRGQQRAIKRGGEVCEAFPIRRWTLKVQAKADAQLPEPAWIEWLREAPLGPPST